MDDSVPLEEEQEVEDGMLGYDEPLSENQLGYTFNEGSDLPVEGPYGGYRLVYNSNIRRYSIPVQCMSHGTQ